MNQDPTIQDVMNTLGDVLDTLRVFSTHVDQRFDHLEADVAVLKSDVAVLKSDVAVLKSDVAVLKRDVSGIKSTMATKDDVILLARQADRKLGTTVDKLVQRNVLNRETADTILAMEPFAIKP